MYFFQSKDETLVRLTNQLHETELSNVMLAATVSNLTSNSQVNHTIKMYHPTDGTVPTLVIS